jgi:ABC-type proline/glycine betaine transport system substrate-binding protein
MNIALDFDETYTEDPALWAAFITKCKVRGHTITFVTYRPNNGDNADIESESECLGINIVYTAGKQKQHCFKADVWIDDSPETIVKYINLCGMKIGCENSNDTEVEK